MNSTHRLIIFCVCFVVFIYFVWFCSKRSERYRELSTDSYNKIAGEEFDVNAENVIKYGEKIKRQNAMDHFRIGSVYLFNAKDSKKAHNHFSEALKMIEHKNTTLNESEFIIDKITEYTPYFIEDVELDDLPLQVALIAHYNDVADNNNKIKNYVPDENETIHSKRILLSRQGWQSDSQNVHDSTMYSIINNQFNKVRLENQNIKHVVPTYENMKAELSKKLEGNEEKLKNFNLVMNTIEKNDKVSFLNSATEKDIISTTWTRMHDPRNSENLEEMKQALIDSCLDCTENSYPVCLTGRVNKIWQSLACLDFEPEIGILKSKQAIKNEIYQKSSNIIEKYLGENGSCSEEVKDAYVADRDTEQLKEIKEIIKKDIYNTVQEYKDLLDEDQVNKIAEECCTVI